jgi:hypothetical protein
MNMEKSLLLDSTSYPKRKVGFLERWTEILGRSWLIISSFNPAWQVVSCSKSLISFRCSAGETSSIPSVTSRKSSNRKKICPKILFKVSTEGLVAFPRHSSYTKGTRSGDILMIWAHIVRIICALTSNDEV